MIGPLFQYKPTAIFLALILPAAVAMAQTGTTGTPGTASVREHAASYTAASSRFTSLLAFNEATVTSPVADISGNSTRTVSGHNAGYISGPPYDLAALLALMGKGSPAIAISQSAEEAAKGDLAGAKAQRYPSLRAESTGAYLGNPQDAIAIPANALAEIVIPNPPIPLIPAVDPFQYSFKLIGELPLFTWGKTGAGIKASEAALVAARIQLASTMHGKRIQLRANLETLACVMAAEEALALQAKAGQRLAALAEQNLRSGFMTRVELLDVRLKVKQTSIAQARLAESRERLLSDLSSLTGLPGLNLGQLILEVPKTGPVPGSETDSQKSIPLGNYNLALARTQIDARRSLEVLAKTQAKGLPDLGLRAELSYSGSRLPYTSDDWEDKTDWQLILSLGASGRLFGDPVKAGAAMRAKAELDQARSQLEDGQVQLRAYIRTAYLNLELLRSRLEYSVLQQEYWAASLSQQETILKLGAGSETEYLSLLMEALGGLAEGYGILAEYRAVILGLEGAAGMARF